MNKTTILYETRQSPYKKGISHVVIETDTIPPYIFSTCNKDTIPKLPSDMVVIPTEQAKRLFNFKKGSLDDVVLRK